MPSTRERAEGTSRDQTGATPAPGAVGDGPACAPARDAPGADDAPPRVGSGASPRKARIEVIDYDKDSVRVVTNASVEECLPLKESQTVTWINVEANGDKDTVQRMGDAFGLHHLVMEDILHGEKRPRMEDLGTYLFISMKMLSTGPDGKLLAENVNLVVGRHYVISFQETEGDVFDPVRRRIREGKRVRGQGPDFLAYRLIDAVVDTYFSLLEGMGEEVEELEEGLIERPGTETLRDIHDLRSRMLFVRRAVWPLREVVGHLSRGESQLVKQFTVLYLRDLYDHIVLVIDNTEALRDSIMGMRDLYLSSISNRTNEVIKFLTVVSVLFLPMTFITSFYGMNLAYLPLAQHPWAFEAMFTIMLVTSAMMFALLRHRSLV